MCLEHPSQQCFRHVELRMATPGSEISQTYLFGSASLACKITASPDPQIGEDVFLSKLLLMQMLHTTLFLHRPIKQVLSFEGNLANYQK